MDFFTVPTLTFGVLYCFFVIGHDRRKILHCNVTRNPRALWVVQQLREGKLFPIYVLLNQRSASADSRTAVDRNWTSLSQDASSGCQNPVVLTTKICS